MIRRTRAGALHPALQPRQSLFEPLESRVLLAADFELLPASLTASDAQQDLVDQVGQRFGYAVDLDRNTAIVGADSARHNGKRNGAAYIFQRAPGTEDWIEVTTLRPPNPYAQSGSQQFGRDVAIDGDFAVVSAPSRTLDGELYGMAYVYYRHAGGTDQWGYVASLQGQTLSIWDGNSPVVAIDGGIIALGTSTPDAVDVYERSCGDPARWDHTAHLRGDQHSSSADFGKSVDIDGDRLVVGAPWEDLKGYDWQGGYVYLFERQQDGGWIRTARLFPDTREDFELFGSDVSLSGDRLAIGSSGERAFVFELDAGSVWRQSAAIEYREYDGDFADTVDLQGDTLVVGDDSWYTWHNKREHPNLIRVYSLGNTEWILTQEIDARHAGEDFQQTFEFDGSTLLVGRYLDMHLQPELPTGSVLMFVDGNAPPRADALETADTGSQPAAVSAGDGALTVVTRNDAGEVFAVRQYGDNTWEFSNLSVATSSPDSTGGVQAWIDPKDSLTYASVPSAEGLLLFRRADDGGWTVRNLNAEIEGTGLLSGEISAMTGRWGRVFIAGLDEAGALHLFEQTGAHGAVGYLWQSADLSATDLADQNMPTPAFSGSIVSFVTSWNAINIVGLDDQGQVHAVWIAPGMDRWRADNLSLRTGAPALVGGLTVYATEWDAINIIGADPNGNVLATWWVPSFGAEWATSDLTALFGGPTLSPMSMTSFVTSWGATNIVGINSAGQLVAYWWAPGGGDWAIASVGEIVGEESAPVGPLRGVADGRVSSISIFGADNEGDVLRYWWMPGQAWEFQRLSEASL